MSTPDLFQNQKILILSPQPWDYLFISKHHYAMELAKSNDVWFLSSPEKDLGLSVVEEVIPGYPRLKIVRYKVPVPDKTKFHLASLYKAVNLWAVKRVLKKIAGHFDVSIDFGCYALYPSQQFVNARTKIFFPVDNFGHISFSPRGAQHIFTVSHVIQRKFQQKGINCHFINHGLSASFAKAAQSRLRALQPWKTGERLQIGYSGNLFSTFLNIPLFRTVIEEHPEVDFHLYGGLKFNEADPREADWFHFLTTANHVTLHGFLKTDDLAVQLHKMDALILCYKADNVNYFGENTHKMIEYLSTGRAIICTHITLYADSNMIEMTASGADEEFPALFSKSLHQLGMLNAESKIIERIGFALNNTYAQQIGRIKEWISEQITE